MTNIVSLCQTRKPELSDDIIDHAMHWAHSEPLRSMHRWSLDCHLNRLRAEGYDDEFLKFFEAIALLFIEDDAEFAAQLRSIAQRHGYVPTWQPENDGTA